jgi:hypothetical protein
MMHDLQLLEISREENINMACANDETIISVFFMLRHLRETFDRVWDEFHTCRSLQVGAERLGLISFTSLYERTALADHCSRNRVKITQYVVSIRKKLSGTTIKFRKRPERTPNAAESERDTNRIFFMNKYAPVGM